MNVRLKDGTFRDFYRDRVRRFMSYYMLEIDISFPPHVQDLLKQMVPVVRKCSVGPEMLSDFQCQMIREMQLTFSSDPLNIADFKPQRQTLQLEYVILLEMLGVNIKRVIRVMSAVAFPLFKKVVDRMLKLKETADSDYQKTLVKLLLNSCFGFLLLKVDEFKNSKLLLTDESMKDAIMAPHLDHFLMLRSGGMMAYYDKRSVSYSSLLAMGVNVLQTSKIQFLERYFFSIRPILQQNGWEHDIVMVDTDSLYACVSAPPLDECGKPLLFSDVLYELREHLDLSFLETNGQKSLFLEELEKRDDICIDEFIKEARLNFHKAGKLKLELPHLLGNYFAIIRSMYIIREKAYRLDILYQENPDGPMIIGSKVTAKCGVPRGRVETFTHDDFARIIGQRGPPEMQTELVGFRSKNFQIYRINRRVKELTTFSRKRFILDRSGQSVPFFYHKIRKLNDECDNGGDDDDNDD